MTNETSSRPLVSVVMSVYNGATYLNEAIESLLSQTYSLLEIIVIDDASTDASPEILSAVRDSRVRLIRNDTNLGLTKSLNKAIALSTGDYIARQDADDRSMPSRIETQLRYIEANANVCAVGCYTHIINAKGSHCGSVARSFSHAEVRHFLKGDTALTHGSMLMRRGALLGVGMYDEDIIKAQDYDLQLRLSEIGDIAILPEYLYEWRNHRESISSQYLAQQRHFVKLAKDKARARYIERMRPVLSKDNSGKPDFTVIMANYNNAQYIGEAISSVLKQVHENWELVICDDASTDTSLSVIEPFLTDSRIRLITNEQNRGYIYALNRLVNESRAEAIGILDSDDTLTFDAIAKMVSVHTLHPAVSFVYSQHLVCDHTLRAVNLGHCRALAEGETTLRSNCVGAFRTFKKRSSLASAGFDPSMRHAEDKDFIYRAEESGPIVFVDDVLYFHRILPQSESQGRNWTRSRASRSWAIYRAYSRRRGTEAPNINENEAICELCYGLGLSLRNMDGFRIRSFLGALKSLGAVRVPHLKKIARGFLALGHELASMPS